MRCSRCEKNNAAYTVEYDTDFGKVKAYLCEDCYAVALSTREKKASVPSASVLCPFCGNGMADYRRSGLVGCAECYKVFARELEPYVVRLQGSNEHCGKEISRYPKYEAAQSLRELLAQREQAAKDGNVSLERKLKSKSEELKLVLFGDDEEEE